MNKPVNKIEELIAELCPEGVEFKVLGEIAQYSRQRIAAADLNNENYVGVDNLLPNKQGKTKSNYVPTSGNLTRFESGDVLLGNIRPYLKKIWRATHTGGTNGDVLAIQINNKEMLQSEFLYYLLSSDDFFNFDMKFAKGAKMPRGNKSEILKFPIPIPTPAIQQEIVKILDTFTTLEAELGAELGARKKQYGYYRKDLMLSNNEGDWKTLGDIYDFQYGEGNTIPNTGGKYPVYGGNRLAGQHDQYNSEDAPVIGHIGAYAGIVNWVNGKHFVTYNGVICKIKTNINPRYGYYLLLLQDFRSQAHAGSQPFISYDILKKATVRIPDLSRQNSVVAILDKFEALVNDISTGLPAELSARRSQYEYYRDKLLTFKPLENEYAKQ